MIFFPFVIGQSRTPDMKPTEQRLDKLVEKLEKLRKPHWTTWAILIISALALIVAILSLLNQFGVLTLEDLRQLLTASKLL
jgi:t-SNARE complex subunit (syntaxin)